MNKMPGNYNARELEQALLDQSICCHNREIAKWFVEQGIREEKVKKGTILIRENDTDDRDLFCITAGRFAIDVGGNIVQYREKHIHIGEMAMILKDGRTATAQAVEDSIVIRIPEELMWKAYKQFPEIWEPIAKTLCDRLHQRRKFFRVRNDIPRVFIGSSGASLRVAKKLSALLKKQLVGLAIIEVWEEPQIFTPSAVIINRLTEKAKNSDFGIFIFAADDKTNIKGNDNAVPRDNVIFEGGMFTATCGLSRTFFVCEKGKDLHIPTDLAGVTYLDFSRDVSGKLIQFHKTVSKLAATIREQKSI